MKIAILGVWHVHAPDYTRTALAHGEVVGFFERNHTLAEAFANQFGLHMDDDAPIPMIKTMTEDNAFYVIKKMDVPSVLCEVGFVTNTTDAANMLDEAWRQAAAMGIAEGILAYVSDAAKMAPEE